MSNLGLCFRTCDRCSYYNLNSSPFLLKPRSVLACYSPLLPWRPNQLSRGGLMRVITAKHTHTHNETHAQISPTKFPPYMDSGYTVSIPGCPLISAATSCVACSSQSRMMLLQKGRGRGGADKEMHVCVCVGQPLRPDMALRGTAGALSRVPYADIHTYGGKPTLISCYYAPLKQLSVQSQMRGGHR